jgi:hypothetical protein
MRTVLYVMASWSTAVVRWASDETRIAYADEQWVIVFDHVVVGEHQDAFPRSALLLLSEVQGSAENT